MRMMAAVGTTFLFSLSFSSFIFLFLCFLVESNRLCVCGLFRMDRHLPAQQVPLHSARRRRRWGGETVDPTGAAFLCHHGNISLPSPLPLPLLPPTATHPISHQRDSNGNE